MRRGWAQWTARNNGNREGFSGGRKRDKCWTYKLVCDGALLLRAASVAAPAATNLPLLVAAEQFLLSNEWSCFLPCWNTTLLWKPRKYTEPLHYDVINYWYLDVIVFGQAEVQRGAAGQRAWFPKRINTSLHSHCVHTHSATYCTETKCLISVILQLLFTIVNGKWCAAEWI